MPRELVVFYSKVCQGAGLTLDSLEPESTALAQGAGGRRQWGKYDHRHRRGTDQLFYGGQRGAGDSSQH